MKKRILVLVMLVVMIASMFTGCGSSNSSADFDSSLPTIGIVQIVEHPSLDTIRENILKGLADAGYVEGETVNVDYKNAQNDTNSLKTIFVKYLLA